MTFTKGINEVLLSVDRRVTEAVTFCPHRAYRTCCFTSTEGLQKLLLRIAVRLENDSTFTFTEGLQFVVPYIYPGLRKVLLYIHRMDASFLTTRMIQKVTQYARRGLQKVRCVFRRLPEILL